MVAPSSPNRTFGDILYDYMHFIDHYGGGGGIKSRLHPLTGDCCKPLPVSEVVELGLMRADDDLAIAEFAEKPTDPEIIKGLTLSESLMARVENEGGSRCCLASMGIYVFNKRAVYDALESPAAVDFSGEVIPVCLAG